MRRFFSLNFLRQSVVYLLVVVEILLALRVLLEFIGARPEAIFMQWLNYLTSPLVLPFEGLFPDLSLGVGWPLNVSIIFGMGMYLTGAVVILYLFTVLEGKNK